MIVIAIAAALALPQGLAVGELSRQPNGRVTPVARAVRVTPGAPRIDGRLDDAAWALADPITAFTQQRPNDGAAPTERTEVRLLYDGEAVYVAARMFDSDPARIGAQLNRRDNLGNQSDQFEVDFDSYHDHQTSFQFYVTPGGSRADGVGASDFPMPDNGWDPVWEAATTRDSLGWTAEIRIPLSQLRFPNAAAQTWGVNFYRYIARKGELLLWSYWPQTSSGYASNFGHVEGMDGLPQPRRLELLPYAAGNERFASGSSNATRAGLDLKYGLTSNLTLDGTINPDFGQVESDPAVVNLTAYETFFQERRPFFVEGAGIFRVVSPGVIPVNGPQYFYSRRVSSDIIGAGKLSGRTAGGWSLGLVEAATDARPFTNYVVARARNDYGGGTTTLGFTGTAVNRAMHDSPRPWLRTSAYTGGIDFARRFRNNAYSVFAAAGGSYVTGNELAMDSTQYSSARWFQRPDAYRYRAGRTSLAGWFAAIGGAKDEGPVQAGTGVDAWSPGFEINDLGWQSRVNRINWYGKIGYQWTRPGRVFRRAVLYTQEGASWNFDGDRTGTWIYASAGGELRNYWYVSWGGQANVRSVADGLTRGGPAGISPASVISDIGVSTDYRKPIQLSLNLLGSRDEIGYRDSYVQVGLTWRPTPALQLFTGPMYDVSVEPQQYLQSASDPTATAMYGRRYFFARIRQHRLDLSTRLDVTFSPALTLQLWVQPFVANVQALDYRELVRPRSTDYVVYGVTPGSTDTPVRDPGGTVYAHELDPDGAGPQPAVTVPNLEFNYRSLLGNTVIRWEYRPGSTLFLVWTQRCGAFSNNPAFSAGRDLGRLCQGSGENVFAVKLNYWLSL